MEILTCPSCKSSDIAEIVYGKTFLRKEIKDKVNKGKVRLGGINYNINTSPTHRCNKCGKEWIASDIQIQKLLLKAKKIAKEYYNLTGKPLGITGEVAEYEASRLLNLKLTVAREAGYDAIKEVNGSVQRVQIKGRCLPNKPKSGQRIGKIDINKPWDVVDLVLLDRNYEALKIYEASRTNIEAALSETKSKARARGALSVSKFKSIGKIIWQKEF